MTESVDESPRTIKIKLICIFLASIGCCLFGVYHVVNIGLALVMDTREDPSWFSWSGHWDLPLKGLFILAWTAFWVYFTHYQGSVLIKLRKPRDDETEGV